MNGGLEGKHLIRMKIGIRHLRMNEVFLYFKRVKAEINHTPKFNIYVIILTKIILKSC